MANIRILLPDQLGSHFHDDHDGQIIILVPLQDLWQRKMHRAKAQWWLSAILHKKEELGSRCQIVECESVLDFATNFKEKASVIAPTSFANRKAFMNKDNFEKLPSRGFVTSEKDFANWFEPRKDKRLRLEDFYRHTRVLHSVLVDAHDEPMGGAWNFDADNRQSPPKNQTKLDLKKAYYPTEDEIDKIARKKINDLEKQGYVFIGKDDVREFAATEVEANKVFKNFIETRLHAFGPMEDASLTNDWHMAHSLMSAPLNIGLLDPMKLIKAVEKEHKNGAPIASVEGFIRQIMGWRDYVWHLYWLFGENYTKENNYLKANNKMPEWLANLDTKNVKANCLKTVVSDLEQRAWVHHIQRLMMLGNWCMQQGINPQELVDWFDRLFIDGHPWVMAANVIGMSQYADGGKMSTKPYTSGGSYINKMSNFCGGCVYKPDVRVGKDACPFTAGYWKFLNTHKDKFAKNPRMSQGVNGLKRLKDLDQLLKEKSNTI
jgi:deoxyribodipyrimidine photolyase-related protein